ncbi:MAG: hypothetical protein RSF81_03180 [Oscillospiraceae bacterium]
MKKLKNIIHDIILSILFGIAISTALIILFLLIGAIMNGFVVSEILTFLRNAMSIIGPIVLLLAAAFTIMVKQENIPQEFTDKWKKIIYHMNYTGVILIASIVVMAVSLSVDWIIFYM